MVIEIRHQYAAESIFNFACDGDASTLRIAVNTIDNINDFSTKECTYNNNIEYFEVDSNNTVNFHVSISDDLLVPKKKLRRKNE